MIMTLQSHKGLRLITPTNIEGKVLKSCIRCRQHKTKCDAASTNPLPCTHCFKRNMNCTLDIITKNPNRSTDLIEKLVSDVKTLKETLDKVISRKNMMVRLLIERGATVCKVAVSTPSISEIESCLNSPASSQLARPVSSFEPKPRKDFTISSNLNTESVSISHKDAFDFFKNYELNFNKFLPIFPDDFFSTIDLNNFYKENELLFWCVILTSHLNKASSSQYLRLSNHIKSLVVEKCWFQTPRSVYTISSLLLLTTWPLPTNKSENISDNLSVKYISLMKSLSLQFGLHKLEFINEFSHKTKMNISNKAKLNNLIRERIYKFININSNYWLIYLGLSNNNYNGFQQDYIINKANKDLLNPSTGEDHYINSLLKISMIQSRLNENINDLVNNENNTSKLINLNMFEIILNDLNKMLKPNNLVKLSIEFSKLQLFIYSFSNVNVNIDEYKSYIQRSLRSCYQILDLLNFEFKVIKNFNQLPIHYKFIVELASFLLIRIFKSPLLNNKNEYLLLKHNFNKVFNIITGNEKDSNWSTINSKLIKTLKKFNKINNSIILEQSNGSFFLINIMGNYLVSSLNYELIWFIYNYEKSAKDGEMENIGYKNVNWSTFGLIENNENLKEIISYIISNDSIFN